MEGAKGDAILTRRFEYLTTPLLLTPRALLDTEFHSPLPDWLHLVSYPARADQVVQEIAAMSADVEDGWAPGLLWEPEPVSGDVGAPRRVC